MNNEQRPTKLSFDEALEIFGKDEVTQTFIENIETLDNMRNTLLKDKLEYTETVVSKLPEESFERWFSEQRWDVLHGRELKEIEEELFSKSEILLKKILKIKPKGSNAKGFVDKESVQQTPLIDIFEGKLIKSGNRFKAICPFHADKNPSFVIYPETNTFHCFGCNESGDVITYVMKSQNIGFVDALKYLSQP